MAQKRKGKKMEVAVGQLVAYEGNPRTPSDGQHEVLKASINGFGFVEDIVAYADPELGDGKLLVVAGHQRLKAALAAGLKTVPVNVYPFRDKREAITYNIMSNRSAELSSWDHKKLNENLEYLDVGGDMNLELTGFSMEEIEEHVTWVRPDFDKTKEELDAVANTFIERHGDKGMLRVLFFRFDDESRFALLQRLLSLKGGRECDPEKLWNLAKEHVNDAKKD